MATTVESQFAVTPATLMNIIDHLTSRINHEGKPKDMVAPFVWGAPGIGKTEIINTIASARGSRTVALHLPQYDPTDLRGIPVNDNGTVNWVSSSYLPAQINFVTDSTEFDMKLHFDYAVGVAIYVFNRDGKEIARFNDPTLPNFGEGEVSIDNFGKKWKVKGTGLSKDVYKISIVDKAIIFLDELSAADPSVQNSALQLVLDRRVGEYDVPHGVPVIAAGNREDDGAFVQPLSHPLCNRFAHITLVPNADEWIDWAILNKLPPEVIGYIKWMPDAIFDYNPDVLQGGEYGFSTPRSWSFLASQYAPVDHFKQMVNGKNAAEIQRNASKLRSTMFAGIVGKARASQFEAYLQVMHDLPSPQDVMDGTATSIGEVERSQSFGLLYALVYNLENKFNTHYDNDRSYDNQDDEWIVPRNNIIKFITDNFDSESASWALSVIFMKTDISVPSLRCEEFLKFSRKHVHVMERVMSAKTS